MQDRNCLKILKCKIWKVVVFFPLPKDNEFAVIMLYGQKFALYPLAGHIKFKFSLKKKKKLHFLFLYRLQCVKQLKCHNTSHYN